MAQMAPYEYQPLGIHGSEIRLISLLPGKWEEEVSIEIETVEFRDRYLTAIRGLILRMGRGRRSGPSTRWSLDKSNYQHNAESRNSSAIPPIARPATDLVDRCYQYRSKQSYRAKSSS